MNKIRVAVGAGAIAIASLFVVHKEGMVLQTYADPVHGWKVPTACAGQTGAHIRPGQLFTRKECEAMLSEELRRKAKALNTCIHEPITDYAAAAVLDLAYNVGEGAVCRSTMVRMINRGDPPEVFCPQIQRFVFVGKKDCRDPRNNCRGIVTRREEATALCLGISK